MFTDLRKFAINIHDEMKNSVNNKKSLFAWLHPLPFVFIVFQKTHSAVKLYSYDKTKIHSIN